MRGFLANMTRAFCLPAPEQQSKPPPPPVVGDNSSEAPLDSAVFVLHDLLDELPETSAAKLYEALTLLEAARSSMQPKLDAAQELARQIGKHGKDMDADVEKWLLSTALPSGVESDVGSFRRKRRQEAPGRKGATASRMKRIMSAPMALTELDLPPSIPAGVAFGGGSNSSPPTRRSPPDSSAPHMSRMVNRRNSAELLGVPACPRPYGSMPSRPSSIGGGAVAGNVDAQSIVSAAASACASSETVPLTPSQSTALGSSSPTSASAAAATAALCLEEASLDWTYDVQTLDADSAFRGLTSLFHELLRRLDLINRLSDEENLSVDLPKLSVRVRSSEPRGTARYRSLLVTARCSLPLAARYPARYPPACTSSGRPRTQAYFEHIEMTYGDNAYHNRMHAADVVLGVYRCLVEAFEMDDEHSAGISALECFAGLFAAAIHDYAHPGTSNAHEIGKDSTLATRYHDESVLESHHLASAFSCLLQPEFNFLASW